MKPEAISGLPSCTARNPLAEGEHKAALVQSTVEDSGSQGARSPKELTASNTFSAQLALKSQNIEGSAEKIRAELRLGKHQEGTLSAFEKIHANTNFSDALFPLIARFIQTPGIDSVIKKLSEEKGDSVSGSAGELYHASVLEERGYRIVSFGFEFSDGPKKKKDCLETDLIVEKDGKYYFVEVKHFPGRRLFDKGSEDKFVSPDAWTKKFFLDVKDSGSQSNKMQNYGIALRQLCTSEPISSLEAQIGPEFEKLRQYLRTNGPTILFSYATTLALSLTKDGKKIILDKTNQTKEITESDLDNLNDRPELDEIEHTAGECAKSHTFGAQFERVPFVLFNKTSRAFGGDKIVANRKIEAPQEATKPQQAKLLLTQTHIDAILQILRDKNVPGELVDQVANFITTQNLIGNKHNAQSLQEVLRPLGQILKKNTQILKEAISELITTTQI